MNKSASILLVALFGIGILVLSKTDFNKNGETPLAAVVAVAQAQTNDLLNPGFEAGNNPWQQITNAGRGIVTAQFHTGLNSLRIAVWNSGSREVWQEFPSIVAGASYYVEGWVKTNNAAGGASINVQWVDASGAIVKTDTLGLAQPIQAWTLYSATFVAPSNAVKVRYQLMTYKDADGAGAAFFDDGFFGQVTGSTDVSAPTVTMDAPPDGSYIIGGSASISADASDDVAVAGVQFFLNGSPLGAEDTAVPYDMMWDTSGLTDGSYTLGAQARDTSGNVSSMASVNVTVTNNSGTGGTTGDTTPPNVSITSPLTGSNVSGTALSVVADATDDVSMSSVQFLLDGQNIGAADTTSPYSAVIDTTGLTNGNHVIAAKAMDIAGNTTVSANVSVKVYNQKILDITYCSPDGLDQKMDVYYPPLSTAKPMPALMFIHGGAWSGGNKDSDVGMYDVPRFNKKGYFVASINYRVLPHKFPAFLEDAKCAIRHLKANAAYYGIDPNRIGVWGHSAGANIAALVGTVSSGTYEGNGGYPEQSSRVQAVATYAGPMALTDIVDFFDNTNLYVGNAFDPLRLEGSPATHASSDDPPHLVVHGTLDQSIGLPQAQKLVNALVNAGAIGQLLTVTNGGHYLTVPSIYKGLIATPSRSQISLQVSNFFDLHVK